MSDRHQELLRQYELLRGHLAWLEKEIAGETAKSSGQFEAQTPAHKVSAPVRPISATSSMAVDADALLTDYAESERHDPQATKRGCLIAFGTVLGLMAAGVATAYFLFYAHR